MCVWMLCTGGLLRRAPEKAFCNSALPQTRERIISEQASMKFLMASPCLHLYELRAKDWSPSLLPPSYGIIWGLRRGPYVILAWVELGRS